MALDPREKAEVLVVSTLMESKKNAPRPVTFHPPVGEEASKGGEQSARRRQREVIFSEQMGG